MTITDVVVVRATGVADRPAWPESDRQAQMGDIYPDSNAADWARSRPSGRGQVSALYVEVRTDTEHVGRFGPIEEEQAYVAGRFLAPALRGRDPLATEELSDRMMRMHRHGRSGLFMTGISVVDCALWDLKGKAWGVPVYRLLGGPVRTDVPAYASMLGHSIDPERAARVAAKTRDEGYRAQKWFFRFGPADGPTGARRNVDMIAAVREAVGPDYPLMADAFMAWDLPYAVDMVRRLEPFALTWLEEPLPPERIGEFVRLKERSRVPIATGEHVYTRWQVRELLASGAVDYVQTDPDWCGGISELVKICSLCSSYGVPVVAHGHSLLPALHVAAAHPSSVVPWVEYLLQHQAAKQALHDPVYTPRAGVLGVPEIPGLGIEIVADTIEQVSVGLLSSNQGVPR